ncbi:MAG: hypothetical protein ACOH5I_12260 [Oligoflexus sp.]
MLDKLDGPWKYLASILMFPVFFQVPFLEFAWGLEDPFEIALAKRILILLPTLAIIFSCWVTILCILTIIFRQDRREFASAIFVTWWDLGRAIFAFWAGIIRFVICLLGWLYGFVKMLIVGFLILIKDTMLLPLRIFAEVSSGSFRPGIPWPAITIMVGWTLIEALIFTFVMTPLVVDVLDGFSDGQMTSSIGLQLILYAMFTIFVLGSYAVIHTLGEAIKEKHVGKIITYTIVELIVALVETVLFYREFVDALVPWFAQHAGDGFELGLFGTLAIAFTVWLGIRCMTWFLFGASAIPTLIALIQRTGVKEFDGKKSAGQALSKDSKEMFPYVYAMVDRFKSDMNWVEQKGDAIVSAFVVPPLQVIAASINFCTLVISNSHLFPLPFKSYKDILDARELMMAARKTVNRNS